MVSALGPLGTMTWEVVEALAVARMVADSLKLEE